MDPVQELLEKYGHDDQRTQAWLTKRGEMLTASEIYKATKDASPALKHEIVMSKLLPKPVQEGPGPRALLWGTRFEPIAKHIYMHYLQGSVRIVDTTCIPHPKYSFLGASPDGIIVTDDKNDFRYGKLVEFKCPISRDFSDESEIPSTYYNQMQLQLECSGMSECDYIEMKFREMFYPEWIDSPAQYKSCFAVCETGQVMYREIEDWRDVNEWRKECLDEKLYWETTYWVFEKYRIKLVPKDPNWLPSNIQSFTEVWETVRKHREAGTLPDHPKEKNILVL